MTDHKMNDLYKLIQENFGQLNHQELDIIYSYFQDEELEKNDYFTKTDQRCNKLSFVKSGILRIYALTDGKEVTQWISNENALITEILGFFFNQPNRWTIQALTPTQLLTITKSNYIQLCNELPKWNEIEKQFIAKCFSMIEGRVFTHLSMSAEERYNIYFEENKALFNKVPLQYIASVLGMSAETFSRIRNRQTKTS